MDGWRSEPVNRGMEGTSPGSKIGSQLPGIRVRVEPAGRLLSRQAVLETLDSSTLTEKVKV